MSFRTPPTPPGTVWVAPMRQMPKALLLPQSRRAAAALPVRRLPPVPAERAQGRPGTTLQVLLHPPVPAMSGLAEVVAAVVTTNGRLPPAHLILLLLRLVAGEVVVGVAVGAVAVVVAEVVAVVEAVVRMMISTPPKRWGFENYSPPIKLCLLSSRKCQALGSGG